MNKRSEILIRIPEKTKKELRIIAIQENTNMTEIIRDLIEDYVNSYNMKK